MNLEYIKIFGKGVNHVGFSTPHIIIIIITGNMMLPLERQFFKLQQ